MALSVCTRLPGLDRSLQCFRNSPPELPIEKTRPPVKERALRARMWSSSHVEMDTRWHVDLSQSVHGLPSWLRNINQALVRTNLELLSRLLIDVRRTVHGISLDTSRQRHRPINLGTGPLGSLNDVQRRSIENLVIVRRHSNSNLRSVHRPPTHTIRNIHPSPADTRTAAPTASIAPRYEPSATDKTSQPRRHPVEQRPRET